MKFIAVLAVFLFCTSYWICNLAFPDDLNAWWDLRMTLTTANYFLCFLAAYKATEGVIRAVFLSGLVFCVGDIIDRYCFSINEFQYNDWLLYIFAIYYTYISYARQTKANT